MADIDIVYEWTGGTKGNILFGIDANGEGYRYWNGRWEPTCLLNNPCVNPALVTLARIAETIGSVTWRAENRLELEGENDDPNYG